MKRKSGTGMPGLRTLVMVLLVLLMGNVSTYAETYSYQKIAHSLDKVAENLEKDHFTYSQCGGKSTYARSKGSRRVTNCALYVSWALQDAGVLKKGQVFWIEKGGKIHGKSAVIAKNKKVKVLHPRKKAKKAGLQKGDICGWVSHTHTAVYAGKDSKGNLLWYSAGRDGGVKKNGKWYFRASKTKAKVRAKRYNGTISTVIRIRNLKKTSTTASKMSSKKSPEKSTGNATQKSISNKSAQTSGLTEEAVSASKLISSGTEEEQKAEALEESANGEDIVDEDTVEVIDEKGEGEELENVISGEANPEEKRDFETEETKLPEAEDVPKDDSVNDEIVDLDKPEERNSGEIKIQNGRRSEDEQLVSKKETTAQSNPGKKGGKEQSSPAKAADSSKQLQAGSPDTGDEGFLVMMVLFALCCTGLLVMAHARKPGSY